MVNNTIAKHGIYKFRIYDSFIIIVQYQRDVYQLEKSYTVCSISNFLYVFLNTYTLISNIIYVLLLCTAKLFI